MHLLTAPTVEPVTVAEAKLAARIDGTEFDAQLPGMIAAARQLAEQATGRQLMAQTWRTELTDWPAATDPIYVHQATAAVITYWNGSAWVTLSPGAYSAFRLGSWTAVAPAIGTAGPMLGDIAGGPRVRIDLTAGATTAADVPDCVKQYIKAMVAYWIDSPAAAGAEKLAEAPFLSCLLHPARLIG